MTKDKTPDDDLHSGLAAAVAGVLMLLFLVASAGASDALVVRPASKHVVLNGYTRSQARMSVAAEVPGKLMQVNYDVGQAIGDQPFSTIDATFISFEIDQVQVSLEKLALARKRQESRVAFLEKEFERIAQLRRSDVTSESHHDSAAQELTQARLELESTQVEMKSLRTRLDELQERRNRHRVVAPRGWVVLEKRVEPGEIISAGHPLAVVADFTRLVIPLYVSGQELDALQKMNPIELDLEGRKVRAGINWVNPEFDERTRKLAIELVLRDYTGPHRGGLLAQVELSVKSTGLMIPKAAVSDRYEDPRVTLKSNGQSVSVVILGENGDAYLVADNDLLSVGQELSPRP